MPRFYAVVDPMFQRAMRNILSITNASPCLVTTTFDGVNPGNHDYSTGLIVRLRIPWGYGMSQANELYGPITVISATQFTLPIDTTMFDAYVIPPYVPGSWFAQTPGQVVPIGEVNEILTMATQNVLPYS